MSKTIHRCSECRHQSVDHEAPWTGGFPPRVGPCSYGGCPCRLTREHVEANNPPVEIPTFPGFDHATGKWAKR